MVETTIKIANLDSLTPKILSSYEDFTQIETGTRENTGYFVFQVKNKVNREVHHIRAFNLNSLAVQQNIDKAITVFLQETLRLCYLNPDAIVLDTLEFHKNKICYAIKPVISPVVANTSNLNISRLLEGLIADLKYLSYHGNVHLSGPRIYQTPNPYLGDFKNHSLQYFMQDWNQILWETSINMERLLQNQNTMQLADISSQFTATKEKENIYHLASSIIEIGGHKKEELQSLLFIHRKFYDKTLRLVLEYPEIDALNLNSGNKDLLMAMMDQEANKRPNLEEILNRINKIEENKTEIYDLQNKEEEKKNEDTVEPCKNSTFTNDNILGQPSLKAGEMIKVAQQSPKKDNTGIIEESKSSINTHQVEKSMTETNKNYNLLNKEVEKKNEDTVEPGKNSTFTNDSIHGQPSLKAGEMIKVAQQSPKKDNTGIIEESKSSINTHQVEKSMTETNKNYNLLNKEVEKKNEDTVEPGKNSTFTNDNILGQPSLKAGEMIKVAQQSPKKDNTGIIEESKSSINTHQVEKSMTETNKNYNLLNKEEEKKNEDTVEPGKNSTFTNDNILGRSSLKAGEMIKVAQQSPKKDNTGIIEESKGSINTHQVEKSMTETNKNYNLLNKEVEKKNEDTVEPGKNSTFTNDNILGQPSLKAGEMIKVAQQSPKKDNTGIIEESKGSINTDQVKKKMAETNKNYNLPNKEVKKKNEDTVEPGKISTFTNDSIHGQSSKKVLEMIKVAQQSPKKDNTGIIEESKGSINTDQVKKTMAETNKEDGNLNRSLPTTYPTIKIRYLDLRTYLADPNPLNINKVDLVSKNIGAEGAKALSKNTSWTNLKILHLLKNNIGAEGATALSNNTSWTNLTTLNLQSNYIGDKGAKALSTNTSWTSLTTLDLESNNIGAEGAAALSTNTSWKNLTTLDMNWNRIGPEGATALRKNIPWTNLTTLNLKSNNIRYEGAMVLAFKARWPNIRIDL